MSATPLSISGMQAALAAKKLSAVELIESSLKLAKAANQDDKLGKVFLSFREAGSLADAKASDERRRQGKVLSPLDGIPIALKDNIVMQGEPCTCGSRFLEKYISPYDSFVVHRLKAAGAIVIGRTNLDEFAMGSSTENSAYGVVRNPWDRTRVPGGSSGGSAVAVGAGIAPLALGSDTGGSVRLPASFCGAVGLKPTYGRVSRYGLVAFASSLDQIGQMSWWVEDSALLLATIAGHDRQDSTSVPDQNDAVISVDKLSQAMKQKISGLRIGVPQEYIPSGNSEGDLDPEVRSNFELGIQQLEKLGAKIEKVSLPHTSYAVACYYIIACAEASANLARFDGIRYTRRAPNATSLKDVYIESRVAGFGAEVQRRIMLGTFVLSSGYYDAYYTKGQQVRTLIRQDFSEAFKQCDLMVTPTAPFAAFKVGEKSDNPLQMYLSDIFTTSINLAGLPAVSVPSGFTKQGLPLGMQVIGPAMREDQILRVGYQLELVLQTRGSLPKWM